MEEFSKEDIKNLIESGIDSSVQMKYIEEYFKFQALKMNNKITEQQMIKNIFYFFIISFILALIILAYLCVEDMCKRYNIVIIILIIITIVNIIFSCLSYKKLERMIE